MTAAFERGKVPQIEIRHRLRIAREFAGLDQAELAELTGVSRTTIRNYEKGHTRAFRKVYLNAWALATGVPRSWIEKGEALPGSASDPVKQPVGLRRTVPNAA